MPALPVDGLTIARLAARALNTLADVSAPSPTSGDVLSWNGSAWVPASASAPGAHALVSGTHTVAGLTAGHVLTALTGTTFGFAALPAASPHDILSTTHSDASGAASVVRGDLLYGNATPKWARLPKGAASYFLKMDGSGTDLGWSAHGLTYSDVGAAASGHTHAGVYLPVAGTAADSDKLDGQHGSYYAVAGAAPAAHALVDATGHYASGLTTGHFLKATGATTYSFGVHGLTYSDVSAAPAAGSSSIVTLGTVTSGIWNAGAVTSSGVVQGTQLKASTTLAGYPRMQFVATDAATNYKVWDVFVGADKLYWGALSDDGLSVDYWCSVERYGYNIVTISFHGHSISSGVWTATPVADSYVASAATWNAKQTGHVNLTSLAGLSYASPQFVKMTGAATFALAGIGAGDLPSHQHDTGDINSGTLPASRGGTGIVQGNITAASILVGATSAGGAWTQLSPGDLGTDARYLRVTGTPATAGWVAYTQLAMDLSGTFAPSVGGGGIVTVGTITSGIWNAGTVTSSGGISGTTGTFTDDIIRTGAAGAYRSLRFKTSTSTRWIIGANDTAEGGANAGSDFVVLRYDDAGAYLGAPLVVYRNTGNVSLAGAVTVGGSMTVTHGTEADLFLTKTGTGAFSAFLYNAGSTLGLWDQTNNRPMFIFDTSTRAGAFYGGLTTPNLTIDQNGVRAWQLGYAPSSGNLTLASGDNVGSVYFRSSAYFALDMATGNLVLGGTATALAFVNGVGNSRTYGAAQVSVTGVGNDIFSPGTGGQSFYVIVRGNYNDANLFVDLVAFDTKTGWTPTTVLGTTTRGSPATRTYSNNGGNLKLAHTGGPNTYTVDVMVLRVG